MAAPYVAGASVLVREAMEMVGIQVITGQSIYEHLKSTSNSVWDNVTKQNYHSLDLDRAIESLLPIDTVGDTFSTGQNQTIQSHWQSDGWINSLSDHDVYRLSPTHNGTISVQLGSEYVDDAVFKLLRGGQETTVQATNGRLSFSVLTGDAVGLSIADTDSIGSYHLDWKFISSTTGGEGTGGGGSGQILPTNLVDLGSVDVLEQSLSGASRYKLTAEHTGLLTIVADAGSQTTGSLQVLRPSVANGTLVDSTVEGNQWRLDVQVTEGQSIEFVLPGLSNRSVHVINVLNQQDTAVTIFGTDAADIYKIDLSHGMVATISGVSYQLDINSTKSIVIDGQQNNDSLTIIGSTQSDKVELRPDLATLESLQLTIRASHFENVQFLGGGGADRAYLYDAATDDRLSIWPNKAELTGVGYAFRVDQVERIFVHAVQGGDDQAFVFDSVGNDSLSVRPQFTSLGGSGFFNFIAGFERVFAYSSAGGVDNAALYDSVGNDLFSTSGDITSIVGTGFSTFARGFENVEAFSTAGGVDRATVFAPNGGKLTSGADYVGMQDTTRTSIARGFEIVETFLAGQTIPTSTNAASLLAMTDTPVAMPIPVMYDNHIESESEAVVQVGDTGKSDTDWLCNLVEQEIRIQRNYLRDYLLGLDENRDRETMTELDLTWADGVHERAVLDEIFSKHS